jgi:membrane-associated protein
MNPATTLALVLQYRYPILVPLAFIAGFPVGMIVGVAIRTGYLVLLPAYICIMLGELIGDVLWYGIGYFWGGEFARRFGKYVGINQKHVEQALYLFRKYDRRILLTSKLTTGFGLAIPILFTAGMSRMSFWRYISSNMFGQLFWSGGLIAVGYFFGNLYLSVNNVFEKATTISFFVIIVFCFLGFVRYMQRRLLQGSTE